VAISQLLTLRAFLIPSSALRTACVHAVPLAGVVASTYFLYHAQRPHPDAPGWQAYMAISAVLCTAARMLLRYCLAIAVDFHSRSVLQRCRSDRPSATQRCVLGAPPSPSLCQRAWEASEASQYLSS